MNLKALYYLFLISFLAFSLKAEAYEGDSNGSTLSPSTIFYTDSESCVSPRNNLGVMLKNDGYTQESVKEKKDGFDYYEAGEGTSYPSYVKTFTKGGYTVRYKYAIYSDGIQKDKVSFDWVEIKFPSKSVMNEFLNSLKASIKSKGFKIFNYPDNPDWYYIGEDDEDLKVGMAWPYDKYWIKGTTVTFEETKGMNPHELFDEE